LLIGFDGVVVDYGGRLPVAYDTLLATERRRIEPIFARLTDRQRIATRDTRRDELFLSACRRGAVVL
jgi:hypothetical protein